MFARIRHTFGSLRRPRASFERDSRPVVTYAALGRAGRLGNQMFQIAAAIGAAARSGAVAAFPDWPYSRFFARPLPSLVVGDAPPTYREPAFSYAPIPKTAPLNLLGFFQSERYFAHCAGAVRRQFEPARGADRHLRRRYGERRVRRACAIHVRRGDYVGHRRFAELAAGDYYERAMALMGPRAAFLVFSDDIAWCRDRFRGPRFVFVDEGDNIEQLFLMTRCDSHIIANSTFSWWGAWLSGRTRIIAPKLWFAGEYADPAQPFAATPRGYRGFHDTIDLIPARWLRI